MFKSRKTPLDVIQSTSRPPRIDEHIRMVDPSLLDHPNWFRESQDMVFCMPVKATKIRHTKNHILALSEPILMIQKARIHLSDVLINPRGSRSRLDNI